MTSLAAEPDNQPPMGQEDLSGRSRLAKNVGASYLSHFVFIIFGFVMPRAVDENIGQAALGIWDLGWSFVSYMNLTMLGIGGAVNRYVARHRASGDIDALNRTVSTVIVLQLCIAVLVLLTSLLLSYLLPTLMSTRLEGFETTARYVIAGLGAGLAIEMAFDVWRGVISGVHRWDVYNGINAVSYTVSSLAMLTVLLLGYGLEHMAMVYLIVTSITEILRRRIARALCSELTVNLRLFNVPDAKELTKFGIKNIFLGAPGIITTQTVNFFVVATLGPAALAVIARPLALIRHIATLGSKFAFVLTPTAGSLQSQHRTEELRSFALQSSRAGWLITAPALAFMFAAGDIVVGVWMGPGYADWTITAVLSAGFLLTISQQALLRVLVGVNAHGQIAKWGMLSTLVFLAAGLTVLSFVGWTEVRAAALVAVTIGFAMGLTVLVIGFRHLRLKFGQFFAVAMFPAIRLMVVIGLALWSLRTATDFGNIVTLVLACLITGVITLIMQRRDVVQVWRELRK